MQAAAAAAEAAKAASRQPLMLPAPAPVAEVPGITTLERNRAAEPARA